ncbi:MAG: FAD-dependent oxidoreductase [Anaerolineales bacterium]|nr:FAD-dependent oxidoreductase [Anaerolineales bacterium]
MKKLNRRDFLKVASIGTASAFALACGLIQDLQETDMPQSNDSHHAKVIVIGAGIAGLAAARTLADKNISVMILEARNRIGGRMWTDSSLGVPLDLGASWIHGVNGNPITELAKRFNVKTVPTIDDNGVVFHADGTEMTSAEFIKLERLYESIYDEVQEIGEEVDEDMSLQQAFDQAIAKRNLSPEELRGLNLYIQYETSLDYAADPKNLSLWEWDSDEEFSGQHVIFPNGYNQITNGLAQGLDIRLNTEVKLIKYSQSGVEVETSNGTFTSEKVVVTIPLGVLKQADVKFEPSLPKSKQESINRINMGVLNKVYLKFPKIFWDDVENISYVGEWAYWLNYAAYNGEPILLAFHGGNKGWALEEFSDDEIVNSAMQTLRFLYGDDIPEPESYLITRWGKDKFSYGAYSHIPPFASGDDFDALFEPVDDILFFAGEATSRKYFATVHGAYLSGVEVGELVMREL